MARLNAPGIDIARAPPSAQAEDHPEAHAHRHHRPVRRPDERPIIAVAEIEQLNETARRV